MAEAEKTAAKKAAVDPTKTAGSKKVNKAMFTIRGKPQIGQRKISMMVYGAPGTGKTTLAATAANLPHMGDVLIIDAERGEAVLDDNKRINIDVEIDRITVTNFEQFLYIHSWLKSHRAAIAANNEAQLRKLQAQVTGEDIDSIGKAKRYNTVIVDSISDINIYCMYAILGIDMDGKISLDEMSIAQFPEFRKNNQAMQMAARAYRNLDMNVIFISSAQWGEDEKKRKSYSPSLTGQLSTQIMALVDIVGYLVMGKSSGDGKDAKPAARRLYMQPSPTFEAKCRFSAFEGAFIEDPTMESLMQGIGLLPKPNSDKDKK